MTMVSKESCTLDKRYWCWLYGGRVCRLTLLPLPKSARLEQVIECNQRVLKAKAYLDYSALLKHSEEKKIV